MIVTVLDPTAASGLEGVTWTVPLPRQASRRHWHLLSEAAGAWPYQALHCPPKCSQVGDVKGRGGRGCGWRQSQRLQARAQHRLHHFKLTPRCLGLGAHCQLPQTGSQRQPPATDLCPHRCAWWMSGVGTPASWPAQPPLAPRSGLGPSRAQAQLLSGHCHLQRRRRHHCLDQPPPPAHCRILPQESL